MEGGDGKGTGFWENRVKAQGGGGGGKGIGESVNNGNGSMENGIT